MQCSDSVGYVTNESVSILLRSFLTACSWLIASLFICSFILLQCSHTETTWPIRSTKSKGECIIIDVCINYNFDPSQNFQVLFTHSTSMQQLYYFHWYNTRRLFRCQSLALRVMKCSLEEPFCAVLLAFLPLTYRLVFFIPSTSQRNTTAFVRNPYFLRFFSSSPFLSTIHGWSESRPLFAAIDRVKWALDSNWNCSPGILLYSLLHQTLYYFFHPRP